MIKATDKSSAHRVCVLSYQHSVTLTTVWLRNFLFVHSTVLPVTWNRSTLSVLVGNATGQ
jgi:hypothetical protein